MLTLSDDATQNCCNTILLYKLADPHQFQIYDFLRAQMDGDEKCTITNNLHLLKDVKW